MGFTTPVFILKNTPELRDKLVRLGYKIGYERYINDDFLATDNDEMFGIDVPYPPEQCNGYIHCGTNEALFLAIAALRDDTDDSQWFVYPPENIWFICDDDDINYARENIKDSVQAAWFQGRKPVLCPELFRCNPAQQQPGKEFLCQPDTRFLLCGQVLSERS